MEEKFIALIKEVFEIEDQEISLDDHFRDYENWDSITSLSVVAMLDDEFGVLIESKNFKQLLTLRDLLSEVEKRMA